MQQVQKVKCTGMGLCEAMEGRGKLRNKAGISPNFTPLVTRGDSGHPHRSQDSGNFIKTCLHYLTEARQVIETVPNIVLGLPLVTTDRVQLK